MEYESISEGEKSMNINTNATINISWPFGRLEWDYRQRNEEGSVYRIQEQTEILNCQDTLELTGGRGLKWNEGYLRDPKMTLLAHSSFTQDPHDMVTARQIRTRQDGVYRLWVSSNVSSTTQIRSGVAESAGHTV